MSTVIVNGKRYEARPGASISVINNTVLIDGKPAESGLAGVVEIRWEGAGLGNLRTDCSVHCDRVSGNIDAGGSVTAGEVMGYVNAGGSVACGKVGGNIRAGGSVAHG